MYIIIITCVDRPYVLYSVRNCSWSPTITMCCCRKVLVCAPSNSAVDNLCLKIATEYKGTNSKLQYNMHINECGQMLGLKVVRVCSKAKESSHSSSCERDATL